jgi:hypothetical protein
MTLFILLRQPRIERRPIVVRTSQLAECSQIQARFKKTPALCCISTCLEDVDSSTGAAADATCKAARLRAPQMFDIREALLEGFPYRKAHS